MSEPAEIGADLAAWYSQMAALGRAAWPGIQVDDQRLVAHLGRHLADPGEDARVALERNAGDLYLACACTAGDSRALEAFERCFLADLGTPLARIEVARATVDEIKQLLRDKLLVATADRPPRISEYSGRGPLLSWVRVAAVNTALSLRRRQQPEISPDENSRLQLPSADADPELAYMKARYRRDFKAAFAAAVALLSPQERMVLRLNFLDGLNIEEIGTLYRVHRATVARWIARARQSLLGETRRQLIERLQLGGGEFESLMGLVQSQLDVSIARYLRQSAG
jgi:RNA polymerase sigma-70 factor (ECF subfamily)